jgi:acetyl-CoA carboxylase biotin carboxyl carrier protein
MMDVTEYLTEQLPALLAVARGSDLQELDLQEGETRVRIRRRAARVPQTLVEQAADSRETSVGTLIHEVTSPLVGTFYRAGRPGMSPLVNEGSRVEEDTIVGIIEALQVLTEVEAGCRGTVTDVRATDGQPVEYGQVLFGITPDD